MISGTCAYVLMDQGGACQGTVGKNMLKLAGTEKNQDNGRMFFVVEGDFHPTYR